MSLSRIPRVHLGRMRPPAAVRAEVESVLIGPDRLRRRVAQLGAELTAAYSGRELVVVALLNGTVVFLADLIRCLPLPLRLDFLNVSSYGSATRSGTLRMDRELRLDVRGRHVLVVDDILDTGRTLKTVTARLQKLKPASLRTCVLLDKPERRLESIQADHVGFMIPDVFVVGYGLDFDERHRNLPFVGVLKSPPVR